MMLLLEVSVYHNIVANLVIKSASSVSALPGSHPVPITYSSVICKIRLLILFTSHDCCEGKIMCEQYLEQFLIHSMSLSYYRGYLHLVCFIFCIDTDVQVSF